MSDKQPNYAAALHLIEGAVSKRDDVPVGHHSLGGIRVVFTFPAHAAVTRGAGDNGDGTFDKEPPPLALSLAAVLLFLERSEIKGGARARRRWAECIRDAARGMEADPPAEATTALAEVQAKMPKAPNIVRSVPAKRTGADEVAITVEAG